MSENKPYNIPKKVVTSLQSKIGMNEHSALVSMIDRFKIQDKAIVIADRGYASFNNNVHCQEKNWSYIIRAKENWNDQSFIVIMTFFI